MHSPTIRTEPRELHVCFLAGVATAPAFMKEFAEKLKMTYEDQSIEVTTQLLFPYGDWHSSLYRQLHEIRKDMFPLVRSQRSVSLGGKRAADSIQSEYRHGSIWIIGHSGGGVAGVHAGEMLNRDYGLPVERIIQIGSPRCAIPPSLKAVSTMYIYAVNARGRIVDPITRLGSWGGWEYTRTGMPRWNRNKYVPDQVIPLRLTGGHPDYFRSAIPYLDFDGKSNLDHIVCTISEHFGFI